jgi:peptidoglycan LD-endopeptidase LytH
MKSSREAKPVQKYGGFLLLGLLLSACTSLGLPATSTIMVPTVPSASQTFNPSALPATPTSLPTDTPLPTVTPTITFTETATATATQTTVPFVYVFPIQPVWAASYVEGTASHGYPAIDIFAVVGTNYVAVTDGVVDFVSYEDKWDLSTDNPPLRGGLSVAIVGDDGIRYYGSHLSVIAAGIAPGIRVTAGQLLGLVGNSGDARNTLSHVHFGISQPTYPEDWKTRRGQVDPFPFLEALKNGQAVSPPLPTP